MLESGLGLARSDTPAFPTAGQPLPKEALSQTTPLPQGVKEFIAFISFVLGTGVVPILGNALRAQGKVWGHLWRANRFMGRGWAKMFIKRKKDEEMY